MLKEINLDEELRRHFEYASFRTGQKEIIMDIIEGRDVLGVLPTGSGKSLCYQLPAKLFSGTTIVVSPLIALMMDQVKELKAKHFKAAIAINSFIDHDERKQIYRRLRHYKLIYASPELLQQKEFLGYLKHVHVSLFVIDEAHCISQWGHEFRPDYLKLRSIIEALDNPPIMALSATATEKIQDDIIRSLNRPNIRKHIYPIDRPNIQFVVKHVAGSGEKLEVISDMIIRKRIPTLIYFSSRRETEHVASHLTASHPNRRIAFYHGGMEQMDRTMVQQQFMNDQLDIICCTSAFGMGINKKNIRLIIHYHMPAQMESFIQEVGRAGRDGKSCLSLLLYAENDEILPRQMIQSELPTESQIKFAFQYLYALHMKKRSLSIHDQEIAARLQINETQWRFLYYQFEKHGMIDENNIVYHKENWQAHLHTITAFRNSRLLAKKQNITAMLQWIHERNCLRDRLYKPFQQTYSKPDEQCCSNCGFSLDSSNPPETERGLDPDFSWEKKLKNLLLLGEENETE